jgi:hypothetical protein
MVAPSKSSRHACAAMCCGETLRAFDDAAMHAIISMTELYDLKNLNQVLERLRHNQRHCQAVPVNES